MTGECGRGMQLLLLQANKTQALEAAMFFISLLQVPNCPVSSLQKLLQYDEGTVSNSKS